MGYVWRGQDHHHHRVPHLRDGFIVANRGPRQLCWWGELGWAIVRSTIRLSSSEPGYPDRTRFVQKVVTVTGPAPVFRFLDEASGNSIAMQVLQLFDSFVVAKDIEIVVAGLPEGSRSEAFGDGEFEGLQGL